MDDKASIPGNSGMKSERIYPSKLLLFGEYTVLSGSQALAVPLYRWKGRWMEGVIDNHTAADFHGYVDWLQAQGVANEAMAAAMRMEFGQGLRYSADIPIGYGLGSSGAYVAALYDRYMAGHGDADAMTTMARMEGYFHGSSSGMDPLVALTAKAAFKDDHGAFKLLDDPGWPEGFYVYLIDSGIGRTTAPLVKAYKQMCADTDFALRMERELRPVVELAIHAYLLQASDLLEQAVAVIGMLQRRYFSAMIPVAVGKRWDELINREGVYMKLCGAGGGGFFLVISRMPLTGGDLICIHPVRHSPDPAAES